MTDADLAAIEQKLSDRIITLVLGLGANDNAVAGWHQHTVDEARAVIMAALRSLPRESGWQRTVDALGAVHCKVCGTRLGDIDDFPELADFTHAAPPEPPETETK